MDWVALLAAMLLSHTPAAPSPQRWETLLGGLDLVRSHAFEDGRTVALESVYPKDSPLLAQDREMLISYLARGVDIEWMRMRLLEVDVVASTSQLVTLRVTDQLAPARIRLPDGTVRELPRDRPTRRIVELSPTAHGWRISAVSLRP